MSWLSESIVKMNGGRKWGSTLSFSDKFGVHPDTTRRWVREGPPQYIIVGVQAMLELEELRRRVEAAGEIG